MARVLVVDDEVKMGRVVAQALELDAHAVTRVTGGRAALIELALQRFDVVLTDLKMPEVDGLAVLQEARRQLGAPEVVILTAYATTESAVEAMRAGAADYLTKPFAMDELRIRVRRLARQRATEERSARLLAKLTPSLVAESAAMKEVLAAATKVAATDTTVLLLGESGTGKSHLARHIHFQSRRAAALLVETHCAALPETLLESELFGHEKGAFTGAAERKVGQLAGADGGTLFLDEIGDVSLATQVKLLRFLQERVYTPVGSSQARRVDARLIAATNRSLEEMVRQGALREDFYYRLKVFTLTMPPLRERPEDVLPLARRFLEARGLPASKLSPATEERIRSHPWPGNVRELENALERALIYAGGEEVQPRDLELSSALRPESGSALLRAGEVLGPGFNLDDFERQLLHAALERSGGNKAAAARLLGITRRRLYSRLQSLGAPDEETPTD